MAIEPLNSAMTYQAQTVQKSDNVQKTDADNKEVITDTKQNKENEYVDDTTIAVNKATDTEKEKEYENENQQALNEKIKKAVEDMNKKMYNSEAIFGIHEKTNRVTIKIVDKDTKDIIKEFPPEKTLDMLAKAWELAGLLVDEKR